MALNPWLQAATAAANSAPGRAVYGSILRNARLPSVGQQLPMPANMLLRRLGSALDSNPGLNEEPPREEDLPLAPAVSENPPSSFQAAQTEAARPAARPAGTAPGAGATNSNSESPEMLEALRQMQANLRAQHMTTEPQQQQLSVLDMLRKRMANAMENEQANRMADLGTALLTSRNPSFFGALGEGFAAQEAGSRSRLDQLRQVAEAERQQRALDIEEARRQEELRIREAAQAAEAPLRAAQTRYYLSRADADPTGVAFTRAENAARGAASAAANQAVQAENNRRSRAVPPLPPLTAAETTTLRDTVFRQSLIERGFTPPAGAAAPATTTAPAAPAVRIDASGREIR